MQPKALAIVVVVGLVVVITVAFQSDFTSTELETAVETQNNLRQQLEHERTQRVILESSKKRLQERFLDVLRDTLCGIIFPTTETAVSPHKSEIKFKTMDLEQRTGGLDWPVVGLTMIGVKRLDNVRDALHDVIGKSIPGDFVECGVWRGGASIFAKSFFDIYEVNDREVWAVDSFDGLPPARTEHDANYWSEMEYLKVSLETVKAHFKAFFVLDDTVQFVKGYFVDSLPSMKVTTIAILRMDGDMYESTMDQLFNLYDKISVGGWIIVDDYGIKVCAEAITDFRLWHNIVEPMQTVDTFGIYWVKQKQVTLDTAKYEVLLNKDKNKS